MGEGLACLLPKQVPSTAALKPPPGSPQGPEEPAHATAAFILVMLLEGDGGQLLLSSCYVDHRAQPRCVSPSVTGEVVPGPRAKGQGCFSEGSSQEGWERRYTEPGSREPMIALFVRLAWMILCSGHGDQDMFSDDQSSCLSQLLLNQIHPLLPSSQPWSRVLPLTLAFPSLSEGVT